MLLIYGVFSYCQNLKNVSFENEAETIKEDAFHDSTSINVIIEKMSNVITGQCGDNVYYTLVEDGLLTISGTGRIASNAFKNIGKKAEVCICRLLF